MGSFREQPQQQWNEWMSAETDRSLSREALQEHVSKAHDLPPRHSKNDGDRLYNNFVSRLSGRSSRRPTGPSR